jgi:hypothetical protein
VNDADRLSLDPVMRWIVADDSDADDSATNTLIDRQVGKSKKKATSAFGN